MIYYLNNLSLGWNNRLMIALAYAQPGDTVVVPTEAIAQAARAFIAELVLAGGESMGGVKVMTRRRAT